MKDLALRILQEETDAFESQSRFRDDVIDAMIRFKNETEQLNIPAVNNLLCGSFDPDTTTSSATKCKCGREKWEHPKTTLLCEFANYILHNANWSESFAEQPWYSETLKKNVSSKELSGLFANVWYYEE